MKSVLSVFDKQLAKIGLIFLPFLMSCFNSSEGLKNRVDKILEDIGNGTAENDFPIKYFPKSETTVILDKLKNYCDFKNRRGKFLNEFREVDVTGANKISFIYEYYLKCDTARLIFTFLLNDSKDFCYFGIESAKKDNPMIIHPEQRLFH